MEHIAWQAKQGTGPAIPEKVLIRALIDAGLAKDDDVIRVLDCRLPHLADPGKSTNSQRRFHTGNLPDTFEEVWDAVSFKFLEKLTRIYASALKEACSTKAKQIIVFFYCLSGHHSSVALASGMQHLLEATQGCLRSQVVHTCENHWYCYCGTDCKEPHACIYLHP